MLPILGVYTSSNAARFPKMMTFKFDVTDLNGENAIQLLQPSVLDYDPTIPCADCQVFVNGVEMLDLVNDRHPIEFTKLGVNYVTVHFDKMTSISCAGDDLVALDDINVNAKLGHFAFFIEPNTGEDYPGYSSPRLSSVPPAIPTITSAIRMFKYAKTFNDPNIIQWDMSTVEVITDMFFGTEEFNQPISTWDMRKVEDMTGMFKGAIAFNQDLSEWDVSSVTNMTSMFENAIHFNRDLSLWCVRNIATAPTKFSERATAWALPKPVWGTCPPRGVLVLGVDPSLGSELTIIGVRLQPEVTALDTNGNIVHQQTITTTSDGAKVTIPATATQVVINPTVQLLPAPVSIGAVSPMIKTINSWKSHASVDHMTFYWISTGCRNLVSVPQSLPINIKRMDSMFADARVFNQSLDSWDVSRVISMGSLFRNAYQFNQPLNSWDVSNVMNMSSMFSGSNFNQPLNNWNVSRVTNMGTMFNGTPFNQDIVGWDTSNVTNMSDMFRSNTSFTKPLLGFNTSKVTNMSNMFNGTYYNQDISNWDTSAVTNMSNMFKNNRQFNQNISGWNTSKVTNMSYMFDGALSFNQPIGNWVTTSVNNMTYMFRGTEFNQNISGWDTSNVTNMSYMFLGTSLFDQPIGGWNVSSATNMTGMFNNARNFNQDLSNWCVVKISTEPGTFATGATAWVLPKPVWGTCPGE